MPVYVGMDCGGTSSRVLAVDQTGKVVFRGQSGPANLLTTPEETLWASLEKALLGCPEPDFVCGCFAGLLTAAEREKGHGLLHTRFPAAKLRLEPDYAAAFSACPSGTDACVIAGTGSIVCSRNYGTFDKSGGGGYLIGDPGSGFRLGRASLAEFLNPQEPISDALRDSVLLKFDSLEAAEVLKGLYTARAPAATVASFAEVFAEDLREKKAYAVTALARELLDLARVVAEHCRRYLPGTHPLQIGLAGSIWKLSTQMGETFRTVLEGQMDGRGFEVAKSRRPAVEGALELAKEMVS